MKKRFVLLLLIVAASVGLIFSWPTIRAGYSLLGFDRPKEYLVVLQNNMELRATGGFMGSYARVKVAKGVVSLEKIEDIYTPDGQLDGHVDPPWPIQAAFGQGWYRLRDSNWDPDFPLAAKTVQWFFEHGKEPKADGLIAVNLSLLERLFELTGPVFVVDEPQKISKDDFYKRTQAAVEEGFFPGSTQKRDFLGRLGRSLYGEISNFSWYKKTKLVSLLWNLMTEKEMMVVSNDEYVQKVLSKLRIDGSIPNYSRSPNHFLAVVDSNLGANKANCCIRRKVELIKDGVETSQYRLVVKYENTNPSSLKMPPQFWGGAYVNYVRIGIPVDSEVSYLKVGDLEYPLPKEDSNLIAIDTKSQSVVDLMSEKKSEEELLKFIAASDAEHIRVDVDIRPDKGIKFIGFFVLVDAMNEKVVELHYRTEKKGLIEFWKQSGIRNSTFNPNVRSIQI